jgi:hypothetical protein
MGGLVDAGFLLSLSEKFGLNPFNLLLVFGMGYLLRKRFLQVERQNAITYRHYIMFTPVDQREQVEESLNNGEGQ